MKIIQNFMQKLKPSYLTAAAVFAMTLTGVTKCDDSNNRSVEVYTNTACDYTNYQADSMKIKHNLNDATVND